MIFFKKKKKQDETIDFTLFERIKKNTDSKTSSLNSASLSRISQENTESQEVASLSNFASMFANETSETSQEQNTNYTNSFIEQKVMDIYDKLLMLEEEIKNIKKLIENK